MNFIPVNKVNTIMNYWLDNQNIMLHAGEMTEQELRSVKAVVKAIKLDLIS